MSRFPKPESFKPDINALLGQMVDCRRNGLYDRVLLKAGTPTPREIVCFQRGVDQPQLWDNGCAWLETNMLHPGRLLPPFDIIIVRFLFLFQPGCSVFDVSEFLRNYMWEFWILNKEMQREPVLRCAVAGNMAELVEGFGQPDCDGTVRPFARAYSFELGEYALYVPPLISFSLKMIGNPIILPSDLDFYPILDGTIDRPVQ